MRIAICDDESSQIQYLRNLIDAWAKISTDSVSIQDFDSAEAFLFTYAEDSNFDILLLDIQMKTMDGIALAKEIRRDNKTLQIIFITGFPDHITEGYEVSALHYLMKPVKKEKLFACLDKACKRIKADTKTILIACDDENLRIRQDEIIFIEAFAHTVIITTIHNHYEIKKNIGELENELDNTMFFRPHRSYLVGLKYVLKIGKTNITLDNNLQIPVSRRHYNDANKTFINFYRGVK